MCKHVCLQITLMPYFFSIYIAAKYASVKTLTLPNALNYVNDYFAAEVQRRLPGRQGSHLLSGTHYSRL